MTPNTSVERVDHLVHQSEKIYDAIDPSFDGEPRHRRMLRVGVNAVAVSLRDGNQIHESGAQLLTLPNIHARQQGPLDQLANSYADVQRATIDRSGNYETDSRHAIHLMKMAVSYARKYYPNLNQGKVATYALFHDVLEAYAGDVASLGMTPAQEKRKHDDEARALLTLCEEYGQLWPELIDVVETYEALGDNEARYVKTFDKLDPGFTHLKNKGVELKNRFQQTEEGFVSAIEQTTQRMALYSYDFPQLMDDRAELTHRVAQVAYQKAA